MIPDSCSLVSSGSQPTSRGYRLTMCSPTPECSDLTISHVSAGSVVTRMESFAMFVTAVAYLRAFPFEITLEAVGMRSPSRLKTCRPLFSPCNAKASTISLAASSGPVLSRLACGRPIRWEAAVFCSPVHCSCHCNPAKTGLD